MIMIYIQAFLKKKRKTSEIWFEKLSQLAEIMPHCHNFHVTLWHKRQICTYFSITQLNLAKILKLVETHCNQVEKFYVIARFVIKKWRSPPEQMQV